MLNFLACYDITDNKKRRKVERLLIHHGVRVQKSVFEIRITIPNLRTLLKDSQPYLEESDSLRIYRICSDCRKASKSVSQTEWQFDASQLVV